MDDPTEFAEVPENALGAPAPIGYSTNTYREHIIDRTGDLMDAAFRQAEEHGRKLVGMVQDPRDDTTAQIVIGTEGVEELDPKIFDLYRLKPLRRRGTASATRVGSFIDQVNRSKDEDSAIFADEDPAKPSLTAVLNYNLKGPLDDSARFGDHRVTYAFPLSPEWLAWFGKNAKPMSMIDFAAFLEDHIVDVLATSDGISEAATNFASATGGSFASPSKLIEIARGLQVNENSIVKETRNLSSGEAEIRFDTQHTDADGKPLVLPNLFVIAIPVFARATVSYRLVSRLRYRKTPTGLVFWYELWRPDLVFTDAFEEACDSVREATGLPLYMGKPEA